MNSKKLDHDELAKQVSQLLKEDKKRLQSYEENAERWRRTCSEHRPDLENQSDYHRARAVAAELKELREDRQAAQQLGYTSVAKALDALSRTKPEKLITLPDWSQRQPRRWTDSFGLSETKAHSYLRAVHRELRLLLTDVPDYFITLPADNEAAWSGSFNDDHPQQFLAKVRAERDELIDPKTYEAVEAKLAEETGKAVNPTRGELHRLLERHFKPLFGRESDWELVKAFNHEASFSADRLADLEARLVVGGPQSQYEAVAFLAPTLFALAGFKGSEHVELQYNGELPQGAALLERLRKELPATKEDWLTSAQNELLTY